MVISYKKFVFIFALGLTLVFLFSSCFKREDFDFNMLATQQKVDYDLALPLISTQLSLGKILGNTDLVYADKDGLLHLVYKPKNSWSLSIGDLLKIPSQNFPPYEMKNIPYVKMDTVIRLTIRDTIPFSLVGNFRIDSLRLSSFVVDFYGNSKIGTVLDYQLSIENLKNKSGGHLVIKDYVSSFSERKSRFDCQNYTLELTKVPGKSGTFIVMALEVAMNMSQVSNELPDIKYGDLRFLMTLRDFQFESAYGYFGALDFKIEDSVDLSLFTDLTVKQLNFEEAFLTLNLTNGASIPTRIKQSEVTAYFKSGSSSEVDLLPQNYDIPYPTPYDRPMIKQTTEKKDVKDLLSNIPAKFEFSLSGSTNPDNDPTIMNVISKDSKLETSFSFDLPLHLSIDGYVLSDTFDFPAIQNISYINDFLLKVNLENAFPIDLNLEVLFLDEENNVLFSILGGQKIIGGTVETDGRVSKPSHTFLQVGLDKAEVPLLSKVKKIAICSLLDTKDKSKVKFYLDSDTQGYIGVKVGAKATFSLSSLRGKK